LISVAVAVTLAAVAVYGSYQPLRKSQLYRQAYEKRGSIHTAAEFTALLSMPLDAPSPIGQAEQVKDTAQAVLTLIEMENTSPAVTVALVNFMNAYFAPIYQRGKGIGFGQIVYYMGTINVIAHLKTGRPDYLAAAQDLFSRGLEASPRRPEFLYGLLDVYRMAGNTEKVKAVAGTILTQWPDDQNTRAALAEYLAQH
jgi:hypothetical protein